VPGLGPEFDNGRVDLCAGGLCRICPHTARAWLFPGTLYR
jgi:hypothetical protein